MKKFDVFDDYGRYLGEIEGIDKEDAWNKCFGESWVMDSVDENGFSVEECSE